MSSVTSEEGERGLIAAARRGDEASFARLLEPLNRELQVYAYRMLGGFQDAEDALQDAKLKAWRGIDTYEPQDAFRSWMYRIVTNTCLDMLRTRKRRRLPQDFGSPVAPGVPLTAPRQDIPWLEPYPDALLPESRSPEAALLLRESVRLALIRALQVLPPRQRAALILHDVLDMKGSEVASALQTTVPAVNSALQRARASMARGDMAVTDRQTLGPEQAEALQRFMEAWQTGNFDRFVSLLADDAIMSMPPWIYWMKGREVIAAAVTSPATWEGGTREGRYHLVPAPMNGQPAALAYVRGADGRYAAVCLTVLTLRHDGQISDLTVFILPEQFKAWGYPVTLD